LINRILKLLDENGVKGTHLALEIGLAKNAISEWKKGKAKPSTDSIIKLAKYFNVTTDYLLTGEELCANCRNCKKDVDTQNKS